VSINTRVHEQLLASFYTEVVEHVRTIAEGLLALEQERIASEQWLESEANPPERESDGQHESTLEIALCAAHSLKGAARAVNAKLIEQLAHSLEDVLDALRQGSLPLTPEILTSCHQTLDAIQAVQQTYQVGRTTPPLEATAALARLKAYCSDLDSPRRREQWKWPLTARAAPGETRLLSAVPVVARPVQPCLAQNNPMSDDTTIQVSASKLDALLSQLTELRVAVIRAERRQTQFHQTQELVADWQEEWSNIRGAHKRSLQQAIGRDCEKGLNGDLAKVLTYISTVQGQMRAWNAWLSDLAQQCAADTTRLSAAIDQLEQETRRLHMQPLSTITAPLQCMVSDLAQQAGKEVILEIAGVETELDIQVLEQLKAPLIHLLRNAIDHGIESPAEREALGKPRAGTIEIVAEPADQRVIIRVADDGAGLDLEAIRQTIARPDQTNTQTLTETDAAALIFDLGISTSPTLTGLSGRGVGLTVVRRNIEALRGQIDLDWQPGAGTVFTLTLPQSLAGAQKAGTIKSPIAE
jgi:two-component system chemotaxis sensor kinase CheA